jgi:hypothetical protein
VFDKATGTSLLGPAGIQTVWQGFGGVCETAGNGDPVVLYDQLADRWIISQFAGNSVPTDECVAVSTTGDATGSYHRYDFHLGSNFFDYPHLSVWPDAYYMSMNVFNSSGTAFLGRNHSPSIERRCCSGCPRRSSPPVSPAVQVKKFTCRQISMARLCRPWERPQLSWSFRAEARIGPSTSM